MRNSEYWQKRSEQVLIGNEKLAIDYEKEMARIYEETKLKTQEQLEAFYQRYAKENNLDLATVKQRLNPAELKKFKTQQQIYLRKIQELRDKGADLTQYNKILEKLSAKAYVTKLQELQNNLNSEIMLLTGEQQIKLTDVLDKSYLEGYYRTMYSVQKGMGMGVTFLKPATDDVLKVLKTPWNGANYSDRLWTNKQHLTNWLNTDLPRHFAAGSSVQQMSKDLKDKLETNRKAATRLVRTEVNHISNESAFDAYENSNVVDKFQYLATLDSRTSEQCRQMDGKIFKLSEKQTGVNIPPLHPNCRSTTVPYFEEYQDEDLERIARDNEGNTYNVPANMSYEEWDKKYGQNSSKQLTKIEPNYEKLTQTEIDKWQSKTVDKITVNSEDYNAIRAYTGVGYEPMNEYLRGIRKIVDNDTLKYIDSIEKSMSKLPKDSILYRVILPESLPKMITPELREVLYETIKPAFASVDAVDISKLRRLLINQTLNDKAFMSTGWKPDTFKYREVELRIKAKQGTKALPIENISLKGKEFEKLGGQNEHEVLLNKDTTLRVNDVFVENNKIILDTTVL